MPPFHGARMRLYGEMMCEIADRSIDSWPVDRSFPVHARLQDITLEVMLRVVFGVADETRLVRLGKAVVEALDHWDVGNPLRPIKALWRFGRVRREIDALLLDEVRRRRAEGPEERTDIMSMLLAARDEDGSAMSDEEVRDEMFTMLVAGHETTATLVAWVIHRLLENPDVLEAARAEVASVVGSGPLVEQRAVAQRIERVVARRHEGDEGERHAGVLCRVTHAHGGVGFAWEPVGEGGVAVDERVGGERQHVEVLALEQSGAVETGCQQSGPAMVCDGARWCVAHGGEDACCIALYLVRLSQITPAGFLTLCQHHRMGSRMAVTITHAFRIVSSTGTTAECGTFVTR